MLSIGQIFFIIILVLVFYFSLLLYGRIIKNINLGKKYTIDGDKGARWKNLFLIAFGQKKMFKKPLIAFLHLCIYLAFLVTQIELFEILFDGLFGTHRVFAPFLGSFYNFVISFIELLSIFAFIATIVFLIRRNALKVKRFHQMEMKGWPFLDANLILFGELILIIGILMMNSADLVLQDKLPNEYHATGDFIISGIIANQIFQSWNQNLLVGLERAGWWLHILVVFAFLLYLPISKHLHIIFAFPNTYLARQKPRGEIRNMEEIMAEVKSMFGIGDASAPGPVEEIPNFGAKDIFDLDRKHLMDAYTCTECGRCTAACPANITGKKLSPRKIVMDVRDRVEEVGKQIRIGKQKTENYDDGKSLFDAITDEEIYACTACNACVEECPVLINPLDIIFELRRYRILNDSSGPPDWMPMFTSLENAGSVWQVSQARDAWKNSD